MNMSRIRLAVYLSILFSKSFVYAQTASTVQGYPVVGSAIDNYSGTYSSLYLDASQFCTSGFNLTAGGCNPSGRTGMWEAIAAAIASPLNISGVIDARAFNGNQIIPPNTGTTALYGAGGLTGSTVSGAVLLGNVTMYCDGPPTGATGNYADGSGSNYGTPCIILPHTYQIIGENTNVTTFSPCLGGNSPTGSGCQNAFPLRQFGVQSTTYSANTLTGTLASGYSFVTTLGPANNQNIYITEPAILWSPSCPSNSLMRTISAATAGTGSAASFQMKVPSTTLSCGSSATLYLFTPVIGFGYQSPGTPYQPVKPSGITQSFRQHLINVGFDLQDYPGALAIQVLATGENSTIEHGYCKHPSAGYLDVGPGSNEFGPVVDIYCETTTSSGFLTNVTPGTFGIYNAAGGGGFHRTTFTYSHLSGQQPNSPIYDDGPSVQFDGEPHNEGTMDAIELAPNTAIAGVTIDGILGPPSGSRSGTNLVHILNDGLSTPPVSGSTIRNLVQQSGGSTTAILDDYNTNSVSDSYLSRYEFDKNGNPISSAISQTSTSIPTLNGGGYTGNVTLPSATPGGIPYVPSSGPLASSASLAANAVVVGGGTSGPATISPDSTVTHALFATTTAPIFRAIGTSDTSINWYAVGGGIAQAQTVTLSPAATALSAGLVVNWKPNAANTASGPTLAVNGLTATTITKCGTAPLVPNDLTTSAIARVIYDGTEFQLQNPQAVTCGSVVPLCGGASVNIASGTTVYAAFGTSNGTEASAPIPVPVSGTAVSLHAWANANLPYTVAVTARYNGGNLLNLSCNLNSGSGATSCDNSTPGTSPIAEGGTNRWTIQLAAGTATGVQIAYTACIKVVGAY